MHIYHVNKPITIDFNCLTELEGKEGREEGRGLATVAWRLLIAHDSDCVLPLLDSPDTGQSILSVG